MTSNEIYPRLFLLKFDSQFELTSTFMRLQEFYESPDAKIKNKHFTWENFITAATCKGTINYWTFWWGFNVPGDVASKFFDLFENELTEKEKKLLTIILPIYEKYKENFYLIGVYKEKDIIHEKAHGLFYLNPNYKKEMIKVIQSYSQKHFNELCNGLKKQGYCQEVFLDEIQAYEIDKKNKKFLRIFNKYSKLDTH